MFQNLPRLNSDFLNTSWQTSRNIPTPKTLSMDFTPPSSSPKPQSEATLSPPLSPRSPLLSSKPSSPRSQSSNSFQKKSFKSKSKELPSPLLSPKSITTRYTPSPKRTPRKRVATAKKALTEESPLRPKEPSRPSSDVSSKDLSEDEHSVLSQTGRVLSCVGYSRALTSKWGQFSDSLVNLFYFLFFVTPSLKKNNSAPYFIFLHHI